MLHHGLAQLGVHCLQGSWAASLPHVVQHYRLLGGGLHHGVPAHLQGGVGVSGHLVGHLLGHLCHR